MSIMYLVNIDGTSLQNIFFENGSSPGYYNSTTQFLYLDTSKNLRSYDISSSGSTLLWTNDTSYSSISCPALLSSGKVIVTVTENFGSYYMAVIDLSTDTLSLVSDTETTTGGCPVVSSDGKIVYPAADGSTRQLFSINADGTDKTPLTSGSNSSISPYALSNGKIAYEYRDSDNSNCEVYIMNNDGTGQQNLTNTTDSDEVIGEAIMTMDMETYQMVAGTCF